MYVGNCSAVINELRVLAEKLLRLRFRVMRGFEVEAIGLWV